MSRVTRPAGPPSVADEPRYQNQQQLHLDRRRTRRVRNHIFGPCLVPKNFANTTDILRWTTLVPPWTNAERNGRSKHGFSFSWCDHAEGPPSCSITRRAAYLAASARTRRGSTLFTEGSGRDHGDTRLWRRQTTAIRALWCRHCPRPPRSSPERAIKLR